MPFLLLVLLSIVVVFDPRPEPFWVGEAGGSTLVSVVFSALAVLGVVAAAAAMARWAKRTVRRNPILRASIRQRYTALRQLHFLGMLGVYGAILFALGWGWAVQRLCGHIPVLSGGIDLLILMPFLITLVGSWACFYDGERALREAYAESSCGFWTRWEYVDFQLRQNLALVAAPLVLMITLKFLYRVTPNEWVRLAVSVAIMALVFIGQPWILRLVLRLKPLPAGMLRDRLVGALERLGFRCSNILVWNTNGGVLNAMVAGLLPYPRYIMMTDRLISELSADEVEAVFGHEIGHIKHGHIPFYAAFLLGCVVAILGIASLLIDAVPVLRDAAQSYPLPVAVMLQFFLLGSVFLVFGFLSRRCERQADVFGCRAVSCRQPDCAEHTTETELACSGTGLCRTGIGIFIDALEKVAVLNGMCRSRPGWMQSWRHSTIARRVDFLHDLRSNPQVEAQFQRTVGRVKWALVWGLVAVLLTLATIHWWGQWPDVWHLVSSAARPGDTP